MKQLKMIDAYILKKYIKTFLLALALIVVIIITFDVSEKLDDFLHNHAPFGKIMFQYYLNFIPGFVNLYSPLFIFISVLFFTSKMAGNTEIIAILGSGISYRRLLRPYMYGSLIVALVVVILGNFVIPVSNVRLSDFENTYIKTVHRNYYSNIHFQTKKGTQVFVESFDKQQKSGYHFHKDVFDENYKLVERVTASQIQYDSMQNLWLASQYTRRTIKGTREKLERKDVGYVDLGMMPEEFSHSGKLVTNLNSFELVKHIKEEELRGSGAVVQAKIELYQRLLNPLAIIIMTLIGVAVSSRKTRGGIGVHLAIGISVAFGFVVMMKVTTVFAINGNLSAFMSVLLPQIIFALAALYLVKTAPK